jgi:4-hydroxythreonine-4-phosphate dehydrogenase
VALQAAERLSAEDPDTVLVLVAPPEAVVGSGRHLPSGAVLHALDPWDGTASGAGRVSALGLEAAVDLALRGHVAAIVTGPVHKPSLHAAGWKFPGQTELLQMPTGAQRVGMLLAAERTRLGLHPLRVLLATTHLPLREVPDRITTGLLVEQATLLDRSLREDWGIVSPRLALCGLNPHASDEGLFGDEEGRVFVPAVERLQGAGISVSDPLPADTVFRRALEGAFDAVVAPYHDVGMAAFKTAAFGSGVNVTLGLPFVRTSPDHGTAFDLVRSGGAADTSSMLEALRLAARLARLRLETASARV